MTELEDWVQKVSCMDVVYSEYYCRFNKMEG